MSKLAERCYAASRGVAQMRTCRHSHGYPWCIGLRAVEAPETVHARQCLWYAISCMHHSCSTTLRLREWVRACFSVAQRGGRRQEVGEAYLETAPMHSASTASALVHSAVWQGEYC